MHTAETVQAAIAFTTFAARTTFAALSADEQRSLFGGVPFGRMPVRWDARIGAFQVQWRTISRDTCYEHISPAKVAAALNANTRITVQR